MVLSIRIISLVCPKVSHYLLFSPLLPLYKKLNSQMPLRRVLSFSLVNAILFPQLTLEFHPITTVVCSSRWRVVFGDSHCSFSWWFKHS